MKTSGALQNNNIIKRSEHSKNESSLSLIPNLTEINAQAKSTTDIEIESQSIEQKKDVKQNGWTQATRSRTTDEDNLKNPLLNPNIKRLTERI